jgi:DNA polymerase-3 subunit alpha
MLGTYISDHPLRELEGALATKTEGSILAIRERGEELSRSGKAVVVGGILAEVQIRTTKAGQQYARTVLEDLGGSLEVTFSVKNFERCSGFLAKDNIVLMKIRVNNREDELVFSAFDVDLLRVDRATDELRLSLRPEDLTTTSIGTLREILRRNPGQSPVVVEAGAGGKSFKLGPDFNVNITSVVGDLRSEFGRDVIKA